MRGSSTICCSSTQATSGSMLTAVARVRQCDLPRQTTSNSGRPRNLLYPVCRIRKPGNQDVSARTTCNLHWAAAFTLQAGARCGVPLLCSILSTQLQITLPQSMKSRYANMPTLLAIVRSQLGMCFTFIFQTLATWNSLAVLFTRSLSCLSTTRISRSICCYIHIVLLF